MKYDFEQLKQIWIEETERKINQIDADPENFKLCDIYANQSYGMLTMLDWIATEEQHKELDELWEGENGYYYKFYPNVYKNN